MKHLIGSLCCITVLAGCAAQDTSDDSAADIAAVAFRSTKPPSLTIFTMVNNRTGAGGHTALMVNASQRVIFDPAGSFRDPRVNERQDVIYGVTPGWLNAYRSAHARSSHHVVSQEIPVSAAQAEEALRLVQANGAVAGAFCAQSTTGILGQIDGFGSIKRTFYPVNLMEQIAQLPNVTTTKLYEDDDGNVVDAVRAAQLATQ